MKGLGNNAVCRLFGCERPIVLAGMGGVARSELVAAVTAAGGFGFLGMVREAPELIASEVERLRSRGVERFGVNIIPAATGRELLEQQVDTIIGLRVPAVTLFWDIDPRLVRRLRDAGVMVVYQVGSAEEAVAAERAGAQAIIAQGREAGGHVRGLMPLQALVPAVRAAMDVPVLAAGGLATGADLVAALALGADGVVLGTALMAAEESFAHDYHKQRLVAAEPGDTLLTDMFHINWPRDAKVRVLSSAVTVGGRGKDVDGVRVAIGDEGGRPIYLFSTDSPLRCTTGDLESMALYAGTGVGSVGAIRSAAAIIDEIAVDVERLMSPALATTERVTAQASSSVCYAGEMGGAYMGILEAADASTEVAALAGDVAAALARRAPRGENIPPFSSELLNLAPWVLALSLLAGEPGGRIAPTSVSLEELPGRIGVLSTRIPEGALRSALVSLRTAVERCMGPQASAVRPVTELV